jgi:hypothetical protein
MIPWKRFWVPLGGSISCGNDGQGFLDDPESEFGKRLNPTVYELTTLLERSPLVLCGEPGLGKTTALNDIRGHIADGEALLWIEFRAIPDTSTFIRRTIGTDTWKQWETSGARLTLIIDGVDEGLIKIPDFLNFLRAELGQFDLDRLRVILACRTAEWPTLAGNELISLWPNEKRERVYELCPLRLADARLAAEQLGIDANRFLETVFQNAVIGLAARPITLFFLLREFSKTGTLPGTHRDLYEIGCARLCAEEDRGRLESLGRSYPTHAVPAPAQIERVAARIAALLMIAGKSAVYTGRIEDANAADLHISEVAIGTEAANGETFTISEFMVLRAIASALFTSRGEHRFGFGHQTFAEALGAKYLAGAPRVQVAELICQRDGSELHVVPQLTELAAWLVGYHLQFREHVLRAEPEVFLRSDVTRFDEQTKHALIDSLFNRVLNEEAFDARGSRRFYSGFAHPRLGAQLAPIIQNKQANLVARRMALEIAGASKVTELASRILELLKNRSEESGLMRFAASALADLLPEDRIGELMPLAEREVVNNEDYEVKAAALERLIPTTLKVRDAIRFMSEPIDEHYFGGYWSFLHYHVPKNIEREDVLPLLEWLLTMPACFGTLSWFKEIAETTALEAVKRLNEEPISRALVTLWLRKIRDYAPLPSGDSAFAKYLAEHPEERRGLIGRLVESPDVNEHDITSIFSHAELFRADDLEWALDTLKSVQPAARSKWAEIVDVLAQQPELLRCWDYFLESLPEIPELAARFQWVRAWEINEPLARKEKARWLRHQRMLKQIAKRNEIDSPESLIEYWLSSGETGSSSAWIPLSTIIFFEEGQRHRSSFDADVTKADGWLRSDKQRQTAIGTLARRFLLEYEDRRCGNDKSNYTFAGYRAGVLLRDEIKQDDALRKAFSEKWLMAVFDFPNNAEPLHQEMVKLAYELDRDASIQKLYHDLLKDNDAHGFMHALQSSKAPWDSELCALVKHFASTDARAHSLESLIDFLVQVDLPCALDCFHVLFRRTNAGNSDREFVVNLLAAAICHLPAQIWESVWSLVSGNDELARIVFGRVANHAGVSGDGVAAELTAEQVADLYCLLVRIFPPEQDPAAKSGTVTARMAVSYLRAGQLRRLIAIADDQACRQFVRLAALFPKQRLWLNWQYRECLTAKRRKLWKPKNATVVLHLLQSSDHRLLENEDDLLELVIESLDRLQRSLVNVPNPEVGDLWNYEGSGNRRHNFAPKDEEDVSGKIAAWLQRDLGPASGVVLNREVQPRRGQKTDVLVDAVAEADHENHRITIVIEVKGCWHSDVRTALETQLVETYLRPNGWSHGIYAVAWFLCPRWDHPTKRPACNLKSQTIEHAVDELRELAAAHDGKNSPFRVVGYLLDCRLPL